MQSNQSFNNLRDHDYTVLSLINDYRLVYRDVAALIGKNINSVVTSVRRLRNAGFNVEPARTAKNSKEVPSLYTPADMDQFPRIEEPVNSSQEFEQLDLEFGPESIPTQRPYVTSHPGLSQEDDHGVGKAYKIALGVFIASCVIAIGSLVLAV